MKRTVYLAMITGLFFLLAVHGLAECSHDYALCHTPDRCGECGAPYSGRMLLHEWDEENYLFDATHHWTPCKYCDEIIWVTRHYADCQNPNVCVECGAACTGPNISHQWADEYASDAARHWLPCENCDARSDVENHRANHCADGECLKCGREGAFDAWGHNWGADRQFDATHCWDVCRDCGEISRKDAHYVLCTTPSVCEYCHVDYKGSRIYHDWDDETWYTNGDYHWYACRHCGAAGEKSEHWAECISPGVCAVCDVPCSGSAISHADYALEPEGCDAKSHWNICERCHEKVNEEEHILSCTNEKYCHVCGFQQCKEGWVAHDLFGNQGNVMFNETHHFYICSDCFEPYWNEDISGEHCAECTAPHVCLGCSIYYEGDNLYHWDDGVYVSDETNHWTTCLDCNAKLNPEPHRPSRYDAEMCAVCDRLLTEKMPGDVNGDGMVDRTDIQALLKFLAGYGNAIDTEAADMNGTGTVTAADVLLLMRYMNDWDVELQ